MGEIAQIDFMHQRDLREQNISRTEALDRVKEIIYLPETDLLTAKMAAEYFFVPLNTLQKCIVENEDELKSDGGYTNYSVDDIATSAVIEVKSITRNRGNAKVELLNGDRFNVGGTGLNLINKRGMLRIAMLLKKSTVAQDVRTAIVRILEEKAEYSRIVYSISKDVEIIKAFITNMSLGQTVHGHKLDEIKQILNTMNEILENPRSLYHHCAIIFNERFYPDLKSGSKEAFRQFCNFLGNYTGIEVPLSAALNRYKHPTLYDFIMDKEGALTWNIICSM